MKYIYKFTGVNTFMTKTSIVSYIIGIIVSVIIISKREKLLFKASSVVKNTMN